MISGLVTTAPSQWKKFRIAVRHARKEILVAAAEPDDLMREHRADDDHLVIVEDQLVDFDRHVQGEQAVGQFADFIRREPANLPERSGIVPLMVEEPDGGVG